MICNETIQEVTRRLVDTYKPLEIYLFGSYAWGHPTEDSDLDVLIVVDTSDEKNYKRAIKGYFSLHGLAISKDLIVLTKKEFDQRLQDSTTLVFKIKKNGKRIYGRA